MAGDDPVGALWRELRAAASSMTLWGQVAAAEMAPGEVSQRILAASERLIAVIERIDEAMAWSEHDRLSWDDAADCSGTPADLDVAAGEGTHCLLRRLLGSEWNVSVCLNAPTIQDLGTWRRTLEELLERPADDLSVPDTGRLACGGLTLDIDRHTVDVDRTRVQVPLYEFRILLVLMANPGRVVRPLDLARAAGNLSATPKQIGDVVSALRKRFESAWV